MIEEWKEIVGYPGYQVSNLGRVKSLVKAYRRTERILKGSPNTTGYILVQLYPQPRERKSLLVHRLVMMTFQPNPVMNELEVNHKDLDITNNSITNLEWVTEQGNKEHYGDSDKFKVAVAKIPKGEAQHLARLTEQDVLDIRDSYKNNTHGSIRKLWEKYEVSSSAMRQVLNGSTWKHLL